MDHGHEEIGQTVDGLQEIESIINLEIECFAYLQQCVVSVAG